MWLHPCLVLLRWTATKAEEVIGALGLRMVQQGLVKTTYLEAVLAREALHPTGLLMPWGGLALPHTDVEHCLKPAIAVATLQAPVPFAFMGDPAVQVPVRLVFQLSVVDPPMQVDLLRRLMDFAQREGDVEHLLSAARPEDVVTLLKTRLLRSAT